MRFKHTPEMLKFIEEGYKQHTATQLTQVFNETFHAERTVAQMVSIIGKYGFKCGRDTHSKNKIRPSGYITKKEIDFLNTHYPNTPAKALLGIYNAEFGKNKSLNALRCTLHRYGIRSNRQSDFVKGHTPWNKGTKGVSSGNSGSFQSKDHPNAHPVGAERQRKGRMPEVKTLDGWKYKHHLIAGQNTASSIAKNDVVVFIDGDKTNFSPSNLSHIDRGTHTRLIHQQFHRAPTEHRPVLLNIAKLETLINKRTVKIDCSHP